MRNVLTGASMDGDARAACGGRRPGRGLPQQNQPHFRPVGDNRPCPCQEQPVPCQDQPQTGGWPASCSLCQHTKPACENCPVMVKPQPHSADCLYDARQALLRGTLFQCLDKPMCSERCQENSCITPCQADQFTLWELQLYLDTHPEDQQALSLMRKLTRQAVGVNCPAAPTGDRWTWPDGPWPWEFQCCGGKGA